MSSDSLNRQLLRISVLLQLEQRARRAPKEVLPFLMVNQTAQLIRYDQAVLWLREAGGRIGAVSGVARPDEGGPYLSWLARVLGRIAASDGGIEMREFTALDLDPDLAGEWGEWLPARGLWVPLPDHVGGSLGGLAFFRQEEWGQADMHLFSYLAEAYGHAMALRSARYRPAGAGGLRRKRAVHAALAAAVLLAAFLPVRQSALAPAEIIPRDPVLIRAPLEGVVDRFHVRPNEAVKKGQKLLSLDRTQLASRLKVALKARDMAQAEHLQAAQQALADPKAKARLALLQGKVEQQQAEAEYLESLLERTEMTAPQDGIAIFEDPDDWLGRPVAMGQKILMVADPDDVELEIRLPAAGALPLAEGAEVLFFPNVAPDRPLEARLNFQSYNAGPTAEGIMAYRLKASIEGRDAGTRLGLKGTAKLFGERTPLIMALLRRPLALARQILAL